MLKINKKILILMAVFVINSPVLFAEEYSLKKASLKNDVVYCAADVKICEDGSTVSRVAHDDCNFKECSSNEEKESIIIKKHIKNEDNRKVKEFKKKVNVKVCTMEFDPVCGKIETGVRCLKNPCPNFVEKTFSNKCVAENSGATEIREGSCDNQDQVDNPFINDNIEKIKQPDSLLEYSEKENKQIPFIFKIINAKNEKERKEILKVKENNKKEVQEVQNLLEIKGDKLPNDTEEKNIKSEEKQKNIDKKSDEIFSKLDYFTNKLTLILNKIESSSVLLKNEEIEKLYIKSKENLNFANQEKAKAWIEFQTLPQIKSKEDAVEKLVEIKELLNNVKINIKDSFYLVKEILNYSKNKI